MEHAKNQNLNLQDKHVLLHLNDTRRRSLKGASVLCPQKNSGLHQKPGITIGYTKKEAFMEKGAPRFT